MKAKVLKRSVGNVAKKQKSQAGKSYNKSQSPTQPAALPLYINISDNCKSGKFLQMNFILF